VACHDCLRFLLVLLVFELPDTLLALNIFDRHFADINSSASADVDVDGVGDADVLFFHSGEEGNRFGLHFLRRASKSVDQREI